jgi:hypothetical protein
MPAGSPPGTAATDRSRSNPGFRAPQPVSPRSTPYLNRKLRFMYPTTAKAPR